MTPENTTKILDSIQPELQKIEDPNTKRVIAVLLNLIEMLASDNARLKHENQLHKDEINRLKGEQGKPEIKPNTKKDGDISSDHERKDAEKSDGEKLTHRIGCNRQSGGGNRHPGCCHETCFVGKSQQPGC